jgi:hypothetical protein
MDLDSVAWISKTNAVSDCQSFISKLVHYLAGKWENLNTVHDVKYMRHALTLALLRRLQQTLLLAYDSLIENRRFHERLNHPLLTSVTLEDLDVQGLLTLPEENDPYHEAISILNDLTRPEHDIDQQVAILSATSKSICNAIDNYCTRHKQSNDSM